jgi:hypothetical protein
LTLQSKVQYFNLALSNISSLAFQFAKESLNDEKE